MCPGYDRSTILYTGYELRYIENDLNNPVKKVIANNLIGVTIRTTAKILDIEDLIKDLDISKAKEEVIEYVYKNRFLLNREVMEELVQFALNSGVSKWPISNLGTKRKIFLHCLKITIKS